MKYFTDRKQSIKKEYSCNYSYIVDGIKIDDSKTFVDELKTITKNPKLGIHNNRFNNYSLTLEVWMDGPTLEIARISQELFNELVANIEIYGSLKEVYNAVNNLPDDIKLKLALK